MSNPDTALIDQAWPAADLEAVHTCPFCGSSARRLAYGDVQDWAFYCAPGKWNYWDCSDCQALYLDPRPTAQSIDRAYSTYYTHGQRALTRIAQVFKTALRNACYLHWFGIKLRPRLYFPAWAAPLLDRLAGRFIIPFGLQELAQMQAGSLLDLGCGSGDFLLQAQQAGWQALGIDLDNRACEVARGKGLRVINAGVEHLAELEEKFDCLFCSHILEHTYDPNRVLQLMKAVLKPGGKILLSLPNAQSVFRYHFNKDWRGLEAPRHLAIPAASSLKRQLEELGFEVQASLRHSIFTSAESFQIRRRAQSLSPQDLRLAQALSEELPVSDYSVADFVHFSCRLRA